MKSRLSSDALAQLFSDGHTAHAFVPHTISDSDIHTLYEIMKWGPTAFNASPARFVFLRSAEAKQRLMPALSPGNVPQVEAASLTVIVAFDTHFYEQLPQLFPAYDARPIRKLPRQVDSSKVDSPVDEGLGRNVRGGTRPRLSCGRSWL